jgi:hypothetical protein
LETTWMVARPIRSRSRHRSRSTTSGRSPSTTARRGVCLKRTRRVLASTATTRTSRLMPTAPTPSISDLGRRKATPTTGSRRCPARATSSFCGYMGHSCPGSTRPGSPVISRSWTESVVVHSRRGNVSTNPIMKLPPPRKAVHGHTPAVLAERERVGRLVAGAPDLQTPRQRWRGDALGRLWLATRESIRRAW